MADFGVNSTQLAGPNALGSAPVEAVQERAVNTSPIDFISGAVHTAFKIAGQNRQLDADAAKQAALKGYSEEQTRINRQLRQGTFGNAEAITLSQDAYDRAVNSNPQFHSELTAMSNGFSGRSVLNKAEAEQKARVEEENSLRNSAIQSGIPITRNTPPEVATKMLSAFQASKRATEDLNTYLKQTGEERAVKAAGIAGNVENRAEFAFNQHLEKEKDKEFVVGGLNRIGAANIDITGAAVKDWSARVASNPGSLEEVKIDMAKYFAQQSSVLTSLSKSHPELASPHLKNMEDMKQLAKDLIDPTKNAETVKAQWEASVNKSKIMLGQTDPRIISLAAVSQIMGNNASVAISASSSVVRAMLEITEGGNTPVTNVIHNPTTQKAVTGLLDKALNIMSSNPTSFTDVGKAKTELANGFNSILKQTSQALDAGMSPQDVDSVMKSLSRPEFGEFVKQGLLNKDALAGAQKVVQIKYGEVMNKAIEAKLNEFAYEGASFLHRNPKGGFIGASKGDSSTEFSKAFTVVSDSAGVRFEPAPGVYSKDSLANSSVDAAQKKLSTASVAMNQMIRLNANLAGTTDYPKYWEDNKHILLPQMFPVGSGQIVTAPDGGKWKFTGKPGEEKDSSKWSSIDGKPTK